MKRTLLATAAMLSVTSMAAMAQRSPLSEQSSSATKKAQMGSYGFDESGMDRTVKPGDDFYDYANGGWAKRTAIPEDKSNYGAFNVLDDLSRERTKGILESARNDPDSKIGAAYASYLDEAAIEAKGLSPIKPWLAEINKLKDKKAYSALAAKAARQGVGGPISARVGQDDKDPETYILTVRQSGLGLPDRDFYLEQNEKMASIRTAYVGYLEKMLTLAGEANPGQRAAALMTFETEVAKVHWTQVESRDADKTYNKMTLAQLEQAAPGFDFASYFSTNNMQPQSLLVAQPSAVTGIAALVAKAPLQVLKDALLVRSLHAYADDLPNAVADTDFAFYGTTLSGTPQREPRWKRGVGFVTDALGEEVGKEYVKRYFPLETKAAMDGLVKNVLAAMGRRIDGLDWMSAQAKARAHKKLAAFTPKIGYPDRWRDYAGLTVKADDLLGNSMRSSQFEYDYNIGKLGKPIYRWEWQMTPMEINAYADFGMVEIVFPAAILQPPFFDPNADPAVNYGAIGSVIGHELSHHFDDQGAKYDETGKLSQWWTDQDVANFKALTDKLVKQYDAYEPLPGARVKGAFTLGENIGDLAGLAVALDAYHASLNGKPAPVINGMTGDQRFYLGWAQVWRRNYREPNLRQRLITDPHSPSQYRADIVRNFDSWYDAFKPAPGDKLYLKPEDRVKIW
ncbi:MAG: M13-type metalloendopeptidase [Sphingobium sp.]|uniref:M13 family metallopeptidase n=1 Tax=Sphingobium sp. TaxID=1912891 RepID=UPI0029B8B514|nr:M13-type metalloendopeptidase [Sphingobium sp.]MDX3911064.1 M13-type metalloendopeptidase [Sphingobium sp.]